MTEQYLRAYRVVLGGSSRSLVVEGDRRKEGLRVTFEVVHEEKSFPQHMTLSIYNLNEEHQQLFLKREFQTIELFAGYGTRPALIFKGEIMQARRIRDETVVNTAIVVLARDSDKGLSFGTIAETLEGGHTLRDQVDACMAAWKPYGITPGHIDDLGKGKVVRPRVLLGPVADKLTQICETAGAAWHVRGGQAYVLKNENTLPDSAIVLNSDTGMVGRPEQTIDGVVVKALLNSKIRPGVQVRIDERSINQAALNPAYLAEASNALLPSIAADGVYKVLFVDEVGDTHGGPWYTIATCLAASGGIVPKTLAPRGIGLGQ